MSIYVKRFTSQEISEYLKTTVNKKLKSIDIELSKKNLYYMLFKYEKPKILVILTNCFFLKKLVIKDIYDLDFVENYNYSYKNNLEIVINTILKEIFPLKLIYIVY